MHFAALALLLTCSNPTAPATTWAALQQELPKDKAKRVGVLLRFARDDSAALDDRLQAVREAASTAADSKKVDADLLQAHLFAVAAKPAKRADALQRAKSDARRLHLEDKAAAIDGAIKGEAALTKLKRRSGKPPQKSEKSDAGVKAEDEVAAAVQNALPSWLAIGDEQQHGAARIALARNLAQSDVDGAVRDLSDAVDALGTSRDSAALRAEGWRALSRLLEPTGRNDEAAAAALAADRAALVNPKVAAASAAATTGAAAAAPAAYTRSRETASLCARMPGVCAKVEVKRWGARTFYDFSKESGGAFDAKRADDVLHEYESTLQDCLAKGAKANLTTNTHVELEWSVGNDGKVLKAFDLRPMRLRGTLVESCLADAYALWRYPPYRGEMQHVRLSFDVGE